MKVLQTFTNIQNYAELRSIALMFIFGKFLLKVKVLKIFIISTPPTMQWLHVDDINEYFTKNGCICNNPIIQGHGNFHDLEISMTRERVRPWKFPSPMENSMAHGNFHARPYLSLDSRCRRCGESELQLDVSKIWSSGRYGVDVGGWKQVTVHWCCILNI